MLKIVHILLITLQLVKIWSYDLKPLRHFAKRSPIDIRPSFNNLPRFLIPHHVSTFYNPITNQRQITTNHIQVIDKNKPNIVFLPQHLSGSHYISVPQATSNVHHSSVHTNVQHVVTNDNVKLPVLTQTLSHSSTNITHPSKLIYNLYHPIVQSQYKNPILVHDLSVIPLRRAELKKVEPNRIETEKGGDDEAYGARFRNFYGGFGEGLTFGGHGAGHGFFAYG